jgi:YHS domain-containing protein
MLLVLVRVVQFLIVLFFVRLVVQTVAALLRAAAPRPDRRADPELVRDRVCNTYVPRRTALRATVGGREEFFCSPSCRSRALSEVARAS